MGSKNNTISSFSKYLEDLSRMHKDIRHSDEKTHFIRLCRDEQITSRKNIYTPVVSIDKLSVGYKGSEDSVRKNRTVELLFLDNVSNASDFNAISDTWDRMEKIADDFLLKMKMDRENRNDYPFLRNFSIDGAELEYLEAVGTLWGVLLSFELPIPFSECLDPDTYLKNAFNN